MSNLTAAVPRQLLALISVGFLSVSAGPHGQDQVGATPTVIFSTYFGGARNEHPKAVAIDGSGNVYVGGRTVSSDYPRVGAGPLTGSGFVTKFDPSGRLVFSRTTANDVVALAVDAAGSLYMATNEDSRATVRKLSPDGSSEIYAITFAGSFHGDGRQVIAVNGDGSVAVTGLATAGMPVINALQPTFAGGQSDAFVARLNPQGGIVFVTYLGGDGRDHGTEVAFDPSGNIFVVGSTDSPDFPTYPSAMQRSLTLAECGASNPVACPDLFVTRFDPTGASMIYSTYLGDAGWDLSHGMGVDALGQVVVARSGRTTEVVKLSADGSRSEFATRLFPEVSPQVGIRALTLGPDGTIYVAGHTTRNDLPMRNAVQRLNAGGPVFRSDDSGATWQLANDGLWASEVTGLASDGRSPAAIYAATDRGVFRLTDRDPFWITLRNGLSDFDVRALAIEPSAPEIVYAATRVGGVFKSLDGGDTWTASNDGLTRAPQGALGYSVATLALAPSEPWNLYLGRTTGVSTSTTGGSHWIETPQTRFSVGVLAVDPRTPSTVYAKHDTVSRSTDAGATWMSQPPVPTSVYGIRGMVIDPRSSAVYATTNSDGFRILKSTDGARTWSALPGLSEVTGHLTLDSRDPSTMYAVADAGIVRSRDSGQNWTALGTLPSGVGELAARDARLLVDPALPSRMFVATRMGEETYVTALTPDGQSTRFATYWGGAGKDLAYALAVDGHGRVVLAGETSSPRFPLVAPAQTELRGSSDLFVTAFSGPPSIERPSGPP